MSEVNRTRISAILGLQAISGVGSKTVRQLLPDVPADPDIPSLQTAIHKAAIKSHIRRKLVEAVTNGNWHKYLDQGQHVVEQADRWGVQLVPWDSPAFPLYLKDRHVADAPAVLYAKGQLLPDIQTVAIVGTREPSAFGRGAAERMALFLAEHGWVIVSGLAKGIDTIAHRVALSVGARTVAILGNGLDTVYPVENRQLADDIVASGGLVLSEQPFGADPSPANLVQRDRLQSGMSAGTVVVETSITGGAMRTARFAQAQKRLLICPVPPPKYADLPSCGGIQVLLAEGAYAIPGREAYDGLVRQLEEERRRLTATSLPAQLSIE